jgi:putative ABC transport system permease protein
MPLTGHFPTDALRGARSLLRTPGFALAAILTLALGIGATAAMFTVVDAVLLRPLPYQRPESRVMIWSRWVGFDKTWVSEAEVMDYRALATSFRQVAAWSSGQGNLTGDGEAVRVGMATVTANTFATLGAEPALGRDFRPEEERTGADAVAVISHGLWQRRYGGDAQTVGRTIVLDGVSRQVVGVMPRGFQLPTDFGEDAAEPTEVWVPLLLNTETPVRGNHGLYAAAELAPGVTPARANAELRILAANLTREGLYSEAMRFVPFAVPLPEEITGAVRPALLMLFGAVGFLLLIACANVANLLLARAEARQREIAVRSALGAGQGRLLAQLFAESLVLALPSAALGLLVAGAGLRLLFASGATLLPRVAEAAIDGRVLAFTAAVGLGTTFLFSLAPALRALRLNLTESLRDGGPNASGGGRRQRLRALLVVAEMALSVVLLLGAGLMLRSLWALQQVDLGFAPEGVLTARLSLPEAGYATSEQVTSFYRQVLERVRSLPGVTRAGLIRSLPLGAQIGDWGLTIEGYEPPPGTHAKGDWQVATDGALEALGERLLRGRSFTAADTADSEQVALVNETMAATYWPGADPLGRRMRMGGPDRPWTTVVGIVRNLRHNGIRAPIKEKFYRPHAQFPFPVRAMTLVAKTAGDPLALAGPLRAAVRELDPNVPVAAVRPMTEVVTAALETPRLAGVLLGLFAALALVLSAVGIYGVLSYVVSQRTQEIGIRVAIGADQGRVLRLVLGGGLRLSLAGIALGSAAALALGRLLASQLHEVRPHDPLTFVTVPLLLLGIALAASYLPARRATRVDPIAALRAE